MASQEKWAWTPKGGGWSVWCRCLWGWSVRRGSGMVRGWTTLREFKDYRGLRLGAEDRDRTTEASRSKNRERKTLKHASQPEASQRH